MFFRAILYLIVFVVAVSVIKSVLGMVGHLFGSILTPPGPQASRGPSGPPSTPPGAGEVLQRDPVCGTFVAPSTAFQKASGGKTYYFCSMHCRNEFKG